MGLRDLFKSNRADTSDADESVPSFGGGEDDAEEFKPRQNGTYQGGPEQYRFLRFHPTGKVYLAAGTDAVAARQLLGPANSDPTVGQYTAAGRFVVVRTFERPIVFTVLTSDDSGFTARLTATDAAHTGEYRYDFLPDDQQQSES